jgi:alkanesulfonate monooxygenase SsuD/methylene tetrahydromethanopterin reductase-like flavin-dependent oxidoreductase (luciferase family)
MRSKHQACARLQTVSQLFGETQAQPMRMPLHDESAQRPGVTRNVTTLVGLWASAGGVYGVDIRSGQVQIGIGLPTMVPGALGSRLAEWSREAEAAGFASLSATDRVVYRTYDAFAALAVAASVTRRVALRTAVLLAPLRPAALIAKSALSLDQLSQGRFELGIGVGNRPDDYEVARVDFHRRGAIMDEHVTEITDMWRVGANDASQMMGPESTNPSGPPLMFGGSSPATWRRVTTHSASWMCGHGGPDQFTTLSAQLEAAWTASGLPGRPRRLMAKYFALGDEAQDIVGGFIDSYFGYAPFKKELLAGTPKTAAEIRSTVERFVAAGCDELVLFPCAGGLEQVKLLADSVPWDLASQA